MSNLLDLPSTALCGSGHGSDCAGAGEFLILGITADGGTFRPSDWSERLCGVLAPFRPGPDRGRGAMPGYSPYARPAHVDGVLCVRIDTRLREIEPMALEFVLNFARDNQLRIST